MILDAIIGLFGSIFALLVEGFSAVFVPLINLIAAGIEAIVSIFVAGFSLGRIERKRNDRTAAGGVLTLVAILCAVGWFVVAPKVMNRTVTLVAKDGHSLPFAALIIHTDAGDRHERTDKAGNIVIPRFGTKALTVKDARYVEQTWKDAEIQAELTVTRTLLGSGLDSLADRLLKPAKE